MQGLRNGATGAIPDHGANIAQAMERIAPYIVSTPCERAPDGLWLKREDLQRSGSFKIRGVLNEVLTAPEALVRRGVVCVSSGNTGRALCAVAARVRTSGHIFVPARTDARRIDLL